jgi:hypothetical protein
MEPNRPRPSAAVLWTGRTLSALTVLFLAFSGGIKLAGHPSVAETMGQLGWPATYASSVWIGVLEIGIALLYAVPRTAVLGLVLMTALLGGAVATHVRVGSPLYSHILFGVYLGLFAWAGLWLREPRLRALLPLRR